MLTPVGEHALLLFWLQLALLLAVARALGALMQRIGQPAVIGELGAGLLVGPTILGNVAPGLAGRLFPGGEVESALVLGVAWLGIALLLTVTGFETDLALLRRLGRTSAAVSIGSLVLPLALGFGLGLALPDTFLGERSTRLLFAGFMAVALSISALPVVAKILQDMRLMRRNFGQITLAAGMVNDLVGWLLLGVLISVANTGGLEPGPLLVALLGIGIFVTLAFTLGQRAIDAGLRRVRGPSVSNAGGLTVTVLAVLVAAAVTHGLGMEAVIGAFVAGIVLGRSRYLPPEVRHELERMSNAVFAPIFFATAGLMVDLGTLFDPRSALAAIGILAVAAFAKLAGAYAGGRLSRLSRMESLATGLGLNARGAMEIVLAAVGLRLGVLNDPSYAAIVLMAMATSMAAPPLLRPVLARIVATPEEEARLDREELLATSVLARATNALLPTRGGANSLLAARALHLAVQPEATVTVLTVDVGDGAEPPGDEVERLLEGRRIERRIRFDEDAAEAIVAEAQLGYDLLAMGLNEGFVGTHELSEVLQRILAETPVPILLVRRGADRPAAGELRRLLVPITGTEAGRAAEEVAYTIAARLDAVVDAVHVVSGQRRAEEAASPVEKQFDRTRSLADRFGTAVSAVLRTAPVAYEELLTTASERESDLIVLGAQVRSHEGRPFLGHGTEFLLERAPQAVLVAVFPPAR